MSLTMTKKRETSSPAPGTEIEGYEKLKQQFKIVTLGIFK
jgi:hypothetical protein